MTREIHKQTPKKSDGRQAPYNRLPLLPPPELKLNRETWMQLAAAAEALAELRIAVQLIPNPQLILRAVLLQEAKLSSEIENIVTTNDALYQGFTREQEPTDPTIKEVLRYEEALWQGFNHISHGNPVTPELIVNIASTVKDSKLQFRSQAGTMVANARTGEAIYTPPEGDKLINQLIVNLCDYIATKSGEHDLVKLAICHYQFEAIHPFTDGNGRTGRILNVLQLVQSKQLHLPIIYLSGFLIKNKSHYYVNLREVTENGNWNQWIFFMLSGIEHSARQAKTLIFETKEALENTIEAARSQMTKGYSKELIELVFRQPYTRISDVMDNLSLSRDASSDYLAILADIGILTPHKVGLYNLYLNPHLMRILTETRQ